mmetsp:Transcript_19124/g.35689  ORF Transcript_19124/g.35689 Transcript_19124/m.35689 type:complete len:101 (+) Transcript_19124:27-329(+)
MALTAETLHLIVICSSSQKITNSIVSPPMITMAQRQGPWPECLGLTGEACFDLIESSVSDDTLDLVIVPEGSILTKDFRKDRVRIFVNGNNVVYAVPGRG